VEDDLAALEASAPRHRQQQPHVFVGDAGEKPPAHTKSLCQTLDTPAVEYVNDMQTAHA
jgi:hypothetical protein